MAKTFPEGFLWGAAGAPHQIEGNNVANDVWALEHVDNSIFAEKSGDAIDFYHRYREDIATLAQLGLDTLRLGVEWSRIEPEQGYVSQAELDHYSRVIDTALEYGVTPVVALHHFSSPRWTLTRRGWKNPDIAKWFADEAYRVVERFGDRVGWYATINEINTPTQVTGNGLVSPELESFLPLAKAAAAKQFGVAVDDFAPLLPWADDDQAAAVLTDAHIRAVEAVHAANPSAMVGVTISMQEQYAEPGGEENAKQADEFLNRRWLNTVGKVGDFIGVQNYTRTRYDENGRISDTEHIAESGLALVPESLAATAREAAEVTGKPVLITEHGADLPLARDPERIAFVRASLEHLADAIADGVDVRGYIHWSLHDNWEWAHGYSSHFGLIEVDRATQKRTPRPSAYELGRIARADAV